jgi:hypothetical protein
MLHSDGRSDYPEIGKSIATPDRPDIVRQRLAHRGGIAMLLATDDFADFAIGSRSASWEARLSEDGWPYTEFCLTRQSGNPPSLSRGRSEFLYYPGMIRIPEGSAPDFKNKSWTVAAEVTIPEGGANVALNGVMLFGVTTAFLITTVQKIWPLGSLRHGGRD